MKHRALPSLPLSLIVILMAAALSLCWTAPAFAEDAQTYSGNDPVASDAVENDSATNDAEGDTANGPEADASESDSDSSPLPNADNVPENDDDTANGGNGTEKDSFGTVSPPPLSDEAKDSPDADGTQASSASDASNAADSQDDQNTDDSQGDQEAENEHEPGLVADESGTRYIQADGTYFADGWKEVDGKSYYFGEAGYALTGASTVDGKLYYFNSKGQRCHGWVYWKAGGRSYFSAKHGDAAAKGWWTIGGKKYYFDAGDELRRAVTSSQAIGGKLYYFNSKGQRCHGWVYWKAGGRSYFSAKHGDAAAKGWWTIGGKKYYFDAGDELRRALSNGWAKIDGKKYYFNNDGSMLRSGWVRWKADGKWSYFGPNGVMYTGTRTVNGVKYNFGTSGKVSVSPTQSKMAQSAQSYSSSTNRLIMIDVTNNYMGIFKGSKGNWALYKYWICSSGAPSTPTVLGQFTVTGKGYSFGHGYTCYYYTQFYGDYLIHSVKYYQGTFDIMDGRMGMNISEGCIRLPLDRAKWVYSNIPRGTKVVIYR